MLIPGSYRKLEKEKGRALSEMGNVPGVAFTREDILEALACLKGSQVAVLGGGVPFVQVSPIPTLAKNARVGHPQCWWR